MAGKRPSRAAVQQRSPAKSQKRWSPQPGHAANGALEAPKNSVLRFTACPHNNRFYQGRRFCVKTTLKKEKRARKEKSASNLAEKSQRPRAETGTLVVRDRDWLRRWAAEEAGGPAERKQPRAKRYRTRRLASCMPSRGIGSAHLACFSLEIRREGRGGFLQTTNLPFCFELFHPVFANSEFNSLKFLQSIH